MNSAIRERRVRALPDGRPPEFGARPNIWWHGLDRPGWRSFAIAMVALAAALFLALYSGAATEGGHLLLAGISDWTASGLESTVTAYATEKTLKLNDIAQPLRVALSGGTISPPIFQSLEFFGQPATLSRLDRCLNSLAPA